MLTCEEFGNSKKKDYLVVFIHGYGSNGQDLLSLAHHFVDVIPNAHFVAPNAPKHCHFGPESYSWFDLEVFEEEYLFKGIKSVENKLEIFIKNISKKYEIPLSNVILIGFSQGTLLSIHHALRSKGGYKGVIGFSGGCLKGKLEDGLESKPEICLIHGKDDEVLPVTYTHDAVENLKRVGIHVEDKILPGIGHFINKEGVEFAKNFLKNLVG